MACSHVKEVDQMLHCDLLDDTCLFSDPDEKRCKDLYQLEEFVKNDMEEDLTDVIYDEEGSYDSIEDELEDIMDATEDELYF